MTKNIQILLLHIVMINLLCKVFFFKKPCFDIENEFRIATDLYIEFGEDIEDAHFVAINNVRRKYKRINIYESHGMLRLC